MSEYDYVIKDDIFFSPVEETDDGTIYAVYYSLGGRDLSYRDRSYVEVMKAINTRCEMEKAKMDSGNHFNSFNKWDALRKTSETIGKIPQKFIVLKD